MNGLLHVLLRGLVALGLVASSVAAHAHKASDAYLWLHDQGGGVVMRLDVALRDLDVLLDLDRDGDGRLTWGEVKAAAPAIAGLARANVLLEGCVLRWGTEPALERRNDGVYASLAATSACHLADVRALRYTLMRDADPTHRGIAHVERAGGAAQPVVLDPAAGEPVPLSDAGAGTPSAGLFTEGVQHILTGYDHVLFLLCLLLPAVLRRDPAAGSPWRPVDRFAQALWPVAGIVTAFTVAHSVTLGLAATGWVSLPAVVIEPAIAITIVLAALDNLVPVFHVRRVGVTFAFGLIHGFGFAGVLGELKLPTFDFAWALLRFNLGIEAGQLAIVLAATGLMFGLRGRRAYPAWVLRGGSVAAMGIGALWFVERVANRSILSF